MNEEKKNKIKSIVKGILYITPFFLGCYGIYQLGEGDIAECAYKSVQLYLMEYSVEAEPLNAAAFIAKMTAPLMTAAFLASLLSSIVENIKIWWRMKTEDVVVIHGDSDNIELFKEKLGNRAIVSEKMSAFQAKKHVLMFQDDKDMYQFINKNGEKLLKEAEKTVYLCSDKILRGCYENTDIVVCNIAENCARTYWKQFPIRMKEEKNGILPEFVNEKILFIGFENYGQRLLTQAILKNVVSDDSAIEYHICGRFGKNDKEPGQDCYESYLDTHRMLHKAVNVKMVSVDGKEEDYRKREPICENQDTVYFHEASWQKLLGREIDFDRVIICRDMDMENMDILNELKTFFVVNTCHVKNTDKEILEQLWDCKRENIHVFGVDEELYDPEVILKEKLFRQAMMTHARYFAKFMCKGIVDGNDCDNQITENLLDESGKPIIDKETGEPAREVKSIKCLGNCLECSKLKDDWAKQNNFIRYSNVAQADHIPVKLQILLGPDVTMDTEHVDKMVLEAYEALKSLEDNSGAAPEEKEAKMEALHHLWKIEHIRWDRYHFMNNWDYEEKRDKYRRKHHLLVRYDELSLYEQSKDEDTYLALAELLAPVNQ